MLYQIAVFIHVLSAVIWVGGMLFLVTVLVPLSRRERKTGGTMGGLLRESAQRFLPIAWSAMALLVVTGIYLGWEQWGVRPGNFFSTGGHFFWILQVKTGLFVAVIALSLVHDFLLGPKVLTLLESEPTLADSAPGKGGRTWLLALARINLLLVLIILVLAVFLVRP